MHRHIKHIHKYVRAYLDTYVIYVHTADIYPHSSGKANAVVRIMNRRFLQPHECCALFDDDNDLQMAKICGRKVCIYVCSLYTCIHIYIYIFIHMSICLSLCGPVCFSFCIYAYMWIYTYTDGRIWLRLYISSAVSLTV